MSAPEVWLRGPLPDIAPILQPAAHALMQVREELQRLLPSLSADEAWAAPGGAASVGYHARHLAAATDRLLTYARGEGLSEAQRARLAREKEVPEPPPDGAGLLAEVTLALDDAVEQLRGWSTRAGTLLAAREVGRARLPSTVLGLLFHVAEHAQRHAGQVATTVKVVRGTRPSASST